MFSGLCFEPGFAPQVACNQSSTTKIRLVEIVRAGWGGTWDWRSDGGRRRISRFEGLLP
jgi:hypothetical protein